MPRAARGFQPVRRLRAIGRATIGRARTKAVGEKLSSVGKSVGGQISKAGAIFSTGAGKAASALGASPRMGGMAENLAQKTGKALHSRSMNVKTMGNMFNVTPKAGRVAGYARQAGETLMSSAPKIGAGVTKYGRLGLAGAGATAVGLGVRHMMKKRKMKKQMQNLRQERMGRRNME